jgi:hypothetical protein
MTFSLQAFLSDAHLLFDLRRKHLSSRPTKIRSRSCAGPVKDGRVSRGHSSELGLDWPEHGGTIDQVG